jgi:hypothetical protein
MQRMPKRPMTTATNVGTPARLSKRQRTARFLADSLSLAIGCGTLFTVHFIGDLYLAEMLIAVASVPLLVLRGRRILRRDLLMVYALMGLWLFGLIVADEYHHILIVDRMRGTALILFFAMDMACISMLIGGNERRKLLYLVGLTIGSLSYVRLQPSPATADYPWKFGYAQGCILLVLLLASYFYNRRRYIASGMLILGICAVNIIFNYRSPVLILLISLVLVHPILPERMGSLQVQPASRTLRVVILLIFTLMAATMARSLIHLAGEMGYLGEEAQAKNEAQSQSGNLLLGGRPEFVIGLQAALDSPIMGHGSWAKDPKYLEMLNDALVERGELEEQVGGDILAGDYNPLIPAHSGIISAWVWAGILGLVFWIYIVWFVLKGLLNLALFRPPFAPLLMFLALGMFWDIFFSPFAANRRISDAFLLIVIADLLAKRKTIPSAIRRRTRFGGAGWAWGRQRVVTPIYRSNRRLPD